MPEEKPGSNGKTERTPLEAELTAISTIIQVLDGLDVLARDRVLSYALQRLGMPALPETRADIKRDPGSLEQFFSSLKSSAESHRAASNRVSDIRSFAEEKMPRSASEKAAVVAYYLSELAPVDEQRASISQDNITKYFKQAGFLLPSSPAMTLVHAKNAGYFESESPGQYKLNAVGYNLVAHRLPPTERAPKKSKKAASKRITAKRATVKKRTKVAKAK